ncbi:hypothetical protein [Armatimonas sp.]|uniref:hypothetical protein n=1 Tax=Armatimonas sp. TaxID=1872638 RepID=UPI003753A048
MPQSPLTPPRAAFYAQVEAAEEARLAPQRAQREREKAAHAQSLIGLETILSQKRDSLQRLELLVSAMGGHYR